MIPQLEGVIFRTGVMTIYLKTMSGKVWSLDSLELTAEASSLTIPALDILFQPRNAKASRRYMLHGGAQLPRFGDGLSLRRRLEPTPSEAFYMTR
ncbi:hypothetical protein F2Q70_00040655 [Brassica cretica]|uniref:Uncharacterized protein n=1 Tax=Brassica cretica TaxID=69181 RepID=A0A8S9K6J3_BRACR|nr:hypothetical protein F2Q70_00040655 [Brassica cretica]